MHKLDEDNLSTYDNYALSELALAEVKLFKTLPTYLGKVSLLKHRNKLILLNKFAAIKRGDWEERTRRYARLAKFRKYNLNIKKRKDSGNLVVQEREDYFSRLNIF